MNEDPIEEVKQQTEPGDTGNSVVRVEPAVPEVVDLSALKDLSIGPNWIAPDYSSDSADAKREARAKGRRDNAGAPLKRVRRARGDAAGRFGKSERRERRPNETEGPRRSSFRREDRKPSFRPTVQVQFSPEEAPFKAMTSALRSSCRTYELFEIARLILEKRERFVVLVRAEPSSDSRQELLYISVPDGLPFDSEAGVIDHVLGTHLDRFLTVEKVEIEPPSGNFQVVNRCSITGEILGPPNYHRYQHLEQEHHRNRLKHITLERFRAKIEPVNDPKVIQDWLQRMTHESRYRLNSSISGTEDAPSFDNYESARHYLVIHFPNRIFRTAPSTRFSGKDIESLPKGGDLRRSIEMALESQKRFPLDTANHLRRRLKRLKFVVYKRGSKGVSFVSAVKRKLRSPDATFALPVQELLETIETHPNIQVGELYRLLCGSEPVVEPTKGEKGESGETERFRQLSQNLRWLVSEGYVTEFGDGRLYSSPPHRQETMTSESDREDERKPHEAAEVEEVGKSEEGNGNFEDEQACGQEQTDPSESVEVAEEEDVTR